MQPNELIAKLRQKDRSSFEELFNRYSPALYFHTLSIVRDPVASNTVLEHVFATAWKTIGEYDDRKSMLFSWMLDLTRRQALLAKKQIVSPTWPEPQQQPESFRSMEGLRELVTHLPGPCATVLSLCYFEDLNDQQIAEKLDLPLSEIKDFKKRGLRMIHRLITAKGLGDVLTRTAELEPQA